MGDPVKVGNPVPLSAQVECPDPTETLYIRAFIYNPANVQLATRDLIDRGNGRFEDRTTYPMPNINSISVQYIAFSDDTYTTQLEEPCPGTEVFQKLEETGGGGGEAVSGVQAVGKIIGGVIRGKVFGHSVLKGRISNNTIKGIVQGSGVVQGKILNDVIQGRIICKK